MFVRIAREDARESWFIHKNRIRFISYLFCRCLSIKEELTCIFVVSKNEFSEKNEVRIVIEELGVSRVMFVFGHAGSNLCDIEMRKML